MNPYRFDKFDPEKIRGHLKTIITHKLYVAKYCFMAGLYKQGLLHDLSKFTPAELLTGFTHYCGDRSPNAVEKQLYGYSSAWLHHKGRNKHHLEYWIDYGRKPDLRIVGVKMPLPYVVEMFCDRIAACKVYRGGSYTDAAPFDYYNISKDFLPLHHRTRTLLERLLVMLKYYGERKTFRYIRKILKNSEVKK